MHLSCDYTVNGGNERCNAYFFDSVGFCRKFLERFLQVVGFLGRTRNSLKPCFGDVRPVELVRASNLSVETSSPSGCDTGQCLFVCVGKETSENPYDVPDTL